MASRKPRPGRLAAVRLGDTTKVSGGQSVTRTRAARWWATHNLDPKGCRQPEEEQTYWRRRLADSDLKQSAAPAAERIKEITAEVADLQRRIERQVANLEAEDTTPALRRRIAARIAELEEAVDDRRRRTTALVQEATDAPPTPADLATALDQLPLIDRLPELPQRELRDLFDSLRLQVAFQPAEAAVDVEVTLFADESPDRRGEVAEVQSVPPGRTGPPLGVALPARCSSGRGSRRSWAQWPLPEASQPGSIGVSASRHTARQAKLAQETVRWPGFVGSTGRRRCGSRPHPGL